MIWFRPCNLFPDRWEWNAISATFANAFEKDDKEPKRTARADDADGAGDQWTEFRLQACGDLLQLSSRANQARFHTVDAKGSGRASSRLRLQRSRNGRSACTSPGLARCFRHCGEVCDGPRW